MAPQDRPELSEKVRHVLSSAKTEAEAAEMLEGLGYSVPAGGLLTGELAAKELDDDQLDKVAGGAVHKMSFS